MANGEENSLGGRVRRYARVGTAVGGLAARLGAERVLGIKMDRERHAADLRAALGGLKGPLMKVAQLMSTIPDALPDEYVQELIQLQSNAPSMGWPFVKRRMASELGPDWQGRFKEFSHDAAAAASLGQVHRATGHDGQRLACKLQYPDMQSTVEADLRQLKLIFSVYERYDRAISTEEIHAEISARLREELDYEREAKHMRLYRQMLSQGGRRPCARAARRAVHEAAADHDMARRRQAARGGEGPGRASQRGRATTCSAPGTCRSISTASSTATRISATTRSAATAASTCSISAASACSRRNSCAA